MTYAPTATTATANCSRLVLNSIAILLFECEVVSSREPVDLVCASKNRFEGGHNRRVKLRVRSLRKAETRDSTGHGVAVRTI